MKTLNNLNLPMNSDITVLDNLVNDNVKLKPGENKKVLQININNENPLKNGEFMGVSLFTDVLSGKVRYEDVIVVDYNLEYLRKKTYNEIASLQDDDIKKIFYAFTRENNDKYYDLYNNSELGQELLRRMEKMMENIDSVFFYDKSELAKVVGEEIGFNNGKIETIKNLIKNKMPEEDIIKFAQISKEELDEIKKSMGK